MERIEKILFYRANGLMLFWAFKGFIWAVNIKKTVKELVELTETEAQKPNSTF